MRPQTGGHGLRKISAAASAGNTFCKLRAGIRSAAAAAGGFSAYYLPAAEGAPGIGIFPDRGRQPGYPLHQRQDRLDLARRMAVAAPLSEGPVRWTGIRPCPLPDPGRAQRQAGARR